MENKEKSRTGRAEGFSGTEEDKPLKLQKNIALLEQKQRKTKQQNHQAPPPPPKNTFLHIDKQPPNFWVNFCFFFSTYTLLFLQTLCFAETL